MKINDVFVIGNGFDLSLGLPTSYFDFIGSTNFLKHLDGSELFCYIHEKAHLQRWIDVESELAVFSKKTNESSKFLEEYRSLCNSLSEYIGSIDLAAINRNSPAYNLLREFYSPSGSYIANFNYTGAVQYILKELGHVDENIRNSVHHVHGECQDGNIIFGVDDRARINPDHVFLYKSTLNHTGGRSFKQALKSARRIFFFGHSLGESDHMYFNDLFYDLRLRDVSAELHFFCYGESGRLELHKQLHKLTSSEVAELKAKNAFHVHDVSCG